MLKRTFIKVSSVLLFTLTATNFYAFGIKSYKKILKKYNKKHYWILSDND